MLDCIDLIVGDWLDLILFAALVLAIALTFLAPALVALAPKVVYNVNLRFNAYVALFILYSMLAVLYFAKAPSGYFSGLGWRGDLGADPYTNESIAKDFTPFDVYTGPNMPGRSNVIFFYNMEVVSVLDGWFLKERMYIDVPTDPTLENAIKGVCQAVGVVTGFPALLLKIIIYKIWSYILSFAWMACPWVIGLFALLFSALGTIDSHRPHWSSWLPGLFLGCALGGISACLTSSWSSCVATEWSGHHEGPRAFPVSGNTNTLHPWSDYWSRVLNALRSETALDAHKAAAILERELGSDYWVRIENAPINKTVFTVSWGQDELRLGHGLWRDGTLSSLYLSYNLGSGGLVDTVDPIFGGSLTRLCAGGGNDCPSFQRSRRLADDGTYCYQYSAGSGIHMWPRGSLACTYKSDL